MTLVKPKLKVNNERTTKPQLVLLHILHNFLHASIYNYILVNLEFLRIRYCANFFSRRCLKLYKPPLITALPIMNPDG